MTLEAETATGEGAAPKGKWGPYGRRPLVVLCLIGLVDAVDRGVLPGVIELVKDDLGLSDFQAGLLSSAIVVATLLVAVPGGLLADRRDRRTLMAIVLCLWSAATALSAGVRSFPQLFAVRSLLGVGDAINDPAAQSLVADYYPPAVRGRAYGWQRVVPTAGVAVGAVVGGVLGEAFGWRVAVLAVALPGLVVAVMVRRLPLPERGASDLPSVTATGAPPTLLPSQASPVLAPLSTRQSLMACLRVPSLRALLFATSITTASLAALGFWGIAYHQRASGLSASKAAAVAGGAILVGAIIGGFGGGVLADRLRGRVKGAALLLGACTTAAGTVLLLLSFNDGIPVYGVRLPLQVLAVALIVAALPALTAMTTEVVRPHLRGTAFGLLKLFANLFAALTPPLIGFIADTRQITVDGEETGDLGFAFRWTVWAVLLGSALLLYGRRHVEEDVRAASA
ncbi:MAG: MFS transporter [Mycobacteriales bacterium]|nr:MFS transporter [Mycobacteriales bacterium]